MILWVGALDCTQLGLSLLCICPLGSLIHLCQLISLLCLVAGWLSTGVIEVSGLCVIHYLADTGLAHSPGEWGWLRASGEQTQWQILFKSWLTFAIVPLIKVSHVPKPRLGVGRYWARTRMQGKGLIIVAISPQTICHRLGNTCFLGSLWELEIMHMKAWVKWLVY